MKHLYILTISLIFAACTQEPMQQVEQWDVYEITLTGPSDGSPFLEVDLSAVFTSGSTEISVPGFYDGNDQYKIRFSPPEQGFWSYQTESSISELSDKSGEFSCIAPTGENHGPLKVVNTHYLEYADGSPFFSVGTTAYQWTSVKQTVQEKTINTLKEAPFNKIRMCVFPKEYIYGNETEPWAYPFKRVNGENDFSQPDYAFFQNFDRRISQLRDMGIQADVILFHPYDDRWGYDEMGKEMNERYVRYMIARISAYRNVWWSLANEWDIPAIKDSIDWEGIGNILMKEDPHNRLRGIHNWYGSEDHFYDHTRPWLTHTCTQTSQFYNAQRWREMYGKPLLFDEMRYEGDVPSGWGNLSGQEMTSYFWQATLSGGYPTHGDTFVNQSDTLTEVRWWAKGGELVGESPERIAYFKSVMEQVPYKEMIPKLVPNSDEKKLGDNVYVLTHQDDFMTMAYTANEGIEMELTLSGDEPKFYYLVDTWNMQVLEERSVNEPGIKVTTSIPYTLIMLSKNKVMY